MGLIQLGASVAGPIGGLVGGALHGGGMAYQLSSFERPPD